MSRSYPHGFSVLVTPIAWIDFCCATVHIWALNAFVHCLLTFDCRTFLLFLMSSVLLFVQPTYSPNLFIKYCLGVACCAIPVTSKRRKFLRPTLYHLVVNAAFASSCFFAHSSSLTRFDHSRTNWRSVPCTGRCLYFFACTKRSIYSSCLIFRLRSKSWFSRRCNKCWEKNQLLVTETGSIENRTSAVSSKSKLCRLQTAWWQTTQPRIAENVEEKNGTLVAVCSLGLAKTEFVLNGENHQLLINCRHFQLNWNNICDHLSVCCRSCCKVLQEELNGKLFITARWKNCPGKAYENSLNNVLELFCSVVL